MKITKAKYTKEFHNHGISEWIGLEAALDTADEPQESLLKIRAMLVETFQKVLSQEPEMPVIDSKGQLDLSGDAEFEALKAKLDEFEYREDAQAYLETTEFKFAVEAKILVNQKPIKNK